MKTGSVNESKRENNRRGMTLVEVLLCAAILGIMAVGVVNALFFPRFLAVSSTLKQFAVQAGTGEIERLRANYLYSAMPANSTSNLTAKFGVKGRSIIASNRVETISAAGYAGYEDYEYKRITVTVFYGNTNVTLVTYRSP